MYKTILISLIKGSMRMFSSLWHTCSYYYAVWGSYRMIITVFVRDWSAAHRLGKIGMCQLRTQVTCIKIRYLSYSKSCLRNVISRSPLWRFDSFDVTSYAWVMGTTQLALSLSNPTPKLRQLYLWLVWRCVQSNKAIAEMNLMLSVNTLLLELSVATCFRL